MNIDRELSIIHTDPSLDFTKIDAIISATIINIIKTDRFYGEILLQLPRVNDTRLSGAIGIGWQNDNIVLLINQTYFIKATWTADQLILILKQVALHLVFKHPLMYSKPNHINQLACDIVVDQYLSSSSNRLNQVNHQLGLKLAPYQGSHYYLKHLQILEQYNGNHSHQQQANKLQTKHSNVKDAHTGWQQFSNQDRTLQTGKLKQMMNKSWQQTPEKQRGTLPGNVMDSIDQREHPVKNMDWHDWLRIGLGNVPNGYQDSKARFNRRQAYRMELNGQISNFTKRINIFVDNSGSMGDSEINGLLNEISRFLKQYSVIVTIYSFDSTVHYQNQYRTNTAQQIKYQRIGGGGTSFQSIFDYLQQTSNMLKDTLTIIMTDGKGEKQINHYQFNDILWILTEPVEQFSLNHNYPGRITSLFEGG